MPRGNCWLPGKAQCVEADQSPCEIIGDAVRPGELVAYARATRILLLLFLAALFGNHFEISPKVHTQNPLCQESRRAKQKQGVSGEAI